MCRFFFILLTVLLLNPACKVTAIRKSRYYHLAAARWPSLLLREDSTFQFSYLAAGKTKFTASDQFSGKFFISSGHWKLHKGILILTSSPDDGKHNIESSHPDIKITDGKPNSSSASVFVFSNWWGDTIEISHITITSQNNTIRVDTPSQVYRNDISTNIQVLIFYFRNYEPYTYINKEQVNKDFYFYLEPSRLDSFFRDEKIRITRKKIGFMDKELELVKDE